MCADPEPNEAIGALLGECSIMKANPCCPKLSNLLETNRGVMRVGLEQLEFLIGQSAHLSRQLPIMMPEFRCREVRQSGVQRPASKSSSARFAAASKRLARMSASICRSHWSAANSSNHSRKRANSTAERCETAASRSSTLIPRKTIDRACNCKSSSHPIRTPILTSLLLR
jgi:hypothetical protein